MSLLREEGRKKEERERTVAGLQGMVKGREGGDENLHSFFSSEEDSGKGKLRGRECMRRKEEMVNEIVCIRRGGTGGLIAKGGDAGVK